MGYESAGQHTDRGRQHKCQRRPQEHGYEFVRRFGREQQRCELSFVAELCEEYNTKDCYSQLDIHRRYQPDVRAIEVESIQAVTVPGQRYPKGVSCSVVALFQGAVSNTIACKSADPEFGSHLQRHRDVAEVFVSR